MSDGLEKSVLSLGKDQGKNIDEEDINKELGGKESLSDDEALGEEVAPEEVAPEEVAPGAAPGEAAPGAAPGEAAPEEAAPGAAPGEVAPGEVAPGAAPGEVAPGEVAPGEASDLQPEVGADEEEPPLLGKDSPNFHEILMTPGSKLSQEDQEDQEDPEDPGPPEDLSEDIAVPGIEEKQDTSMNELQKEVSRHTKELELLRQIVKFLLKNKKTKKKPRNKTPARASKKKKSEKKPRRKKSIRKGKQSVSKRMR